jgi:hypothetical protein
MLSQDQAYKLVQESLDSLQRSGFLPAGIVLSGETILLGTGSPLDSMAFATFLTDLEDRLNRATGKELYLELGEIHEFNQDGAALSANMVARHIASLAVD